jgi:tripartite ATP-independent transporter DctM subunit
MLRHGYNKDLSVGVIAASGTLGQIIPPSIVLVVLADQLGISVGDLFIGSFIPGLLMAGAFITHVVVIAIVRPDLVPALPKELLAVRGRELAIKVVQVMIPPLILILLVLGSIFFGVATPTEAGALGALGAIILAFFNRQLTWSALRDVSDSTLRTTSMVMFILIGSTAFSLVFRGLHGDRFIYDALTQLPGGQVSFLLVSMTTIFLLGFFIDFFEIAFIVVPLFAPIAEQLYGFGGLVWYGVIVGANMQTSFLTPPFGFALFYLRGIAPPEIRTDNIYRGVIPFILLQLLILVLIIAFPALVNYLPSLNW